MALLLLHSWMTMFFEKPITKWENCKYLSEHRLLCLPEREGVYMKNNHSCTGILRDNAHSQTQLSSHNSSWVSTSTSSSLASSEINWALSQCSSPPRSWDSQACSKWSTISHLSCCHPHWSKHVLFLTIYLAFMHRCKTEGYCLGKLLFYIIWGLVVGHNTL